MSNRVVILAGGLSPERDVSLRSGRRIAEEMRELGADVEVRDIDASLLPSLQSDRPSCAIPLVHGAAGEDGAIQQILETMGIPFVGTGSNGCRRAFDKSIAASLLVPSGIAIPDSIVLPHSMFRELGAHQVLDLVTQRLGLPLVVKPSRGGSALGVAVVHDTAQLPAAMVAAMAYGDTVVIQRFVAGTEVAIAVIETDKGIEALPAVEIVPDSGVYDYQTRYTAGTAEFFVPARLDAQVLARASHTAVMAHELLGLRDWSRSDLIVDPSGIPWFLEVNVAPGMTETSLFPQAVEATGVRMGQLVGDLIERAINRT